MKARSLMVASCRLVRMPIRDIRDALGAHHAVMKDVVAGGVCNNANSGASSLHTVLVSFNDPDHRSNIYLSFCSQSTRRTVYNGSYTLWERSYECRT